MLFEIVNPSDPYTLKTDNFGAACVACLALGGTTYCVKQIDAAPGEAPKEMPLFLLAQDSVDPWFHREFGMGIDAFFEANRPAVADALESVLIGSRRDREEYERALAMIDDPEKRKVWCDEWHDKRRTSMNDIGARAASYAKNLRLIAA
jgi:hypothetical protein